MDNAGVAAQLLGNVWANGQAGAAAAAAAQENFEIELEDEDDRDADGTLDGGVAHNPDDETTKRRSSECDLVLFLACEEAFDVAPDHPVLRPGVTVSIGLDKNTKLAAVFTRYVDFCNEHSLQQQGKNKKSSTNHAGRIRVADMEFFHCQLLHSNDTAEASALMKNDKIIVRKVRVAEREAQAESKKLQRDADRNMFQQLRHLMPDLGGSRTADVILDCQGKLLDPSGRHQRVLSTTVRAHSSIIGKRCTWLGAIIQKARNEARKNEEMTNTTSEDDDDGTSSKADSVRRVDSIKSADDEDDEIAVLSFSPKDEKDEDSSSVAEIENDDEDEDQQYDASNTDSPAIVPAQPRSRSHRELLWVTIPDHSPEAVKLLLEYCYTNRVPQLGQEAFTQGCKTRPHKHQGPVPPYQNSSSGSRRWPNNGLPIVSFSVTLSGIALAEAAGMHRLSLMCEVAASQLVNASNVAEALAMCSAQKTDSGADLPRLRKAAMDIILRSGQRGVVELSRNPGFRKALDERRDIVPTLLQGTMEAVTTYDKTHGHKRDHNQISQHTFDDLNREDSYIRERERRKRRLERNPNRKGEHAYDEEYDDLYDPILPRWNAENSKRSLKRMSSHNLDARSAAMLATRSRGFSFPASSRRSTGRRRTNQS